MAITFVGSASANVAGADVTVDLTAIAGLAEDDFVIFGYGIGSFSDETMSLVSATGWTSHSDLYYNDTRDSNLGVFSKVMGVTVDTSVTGAGASGSYGHAAIAMAFRGVDTTTPLDVAIVEATGGNTYFPDPPQITFLDSGAAVVIFTASAHTQSTDTTTWPTGYDNVDSLTETNNSSTDLHASMAYNLSPTSPENPGAITYNGSDSGDFSWCAVTIALRPAASGSSFQAAWAIHANTIIG